MLERMWGKANTPPLLEGVKTCTTTLENQYGGFSKIVNQSISRPRDTTLGHIPEGCTFIPQRCLLNYVYSSIICHSQNLETTYMPLNQRMGKENVVHLYNFFLKGI